MRWIDPKNLRAYLCLVLSLLFLSLPGQEQQIRFEYFGVENGLPQGQIFSIIEDRQGFLWLGTMSGLVKYDGYRFSRTAPGPGDETGFVGRAVGTLMEDDRGFIWAGTHRGLVIYDRRNQSFHRNFPMGGDLSILSDLYIGSIQADEDQRVWITTDRGMFVFVPSLGQLLSFDSTFTCVNTSIEPPLYFSHVRQGKPGYTWAQSNKGMLKIDFAGRRFMLYDYEQLISFSQRSFPAGDASALRSFLFFSRNGYYYFWDPFTESYCPAPLPQEWLIHRFHPPVITDDGNFWLFPNKSSDGIFFLKPDNGEWTRFPYALTNRFRPGFKDMQTYYYDRHHNLWIGTFNGLYKVNRQAVKFPFYQQEPGYHLPENQIYRTHVDRRGGWWFSTYDGRLFHNPTPGKKAKEIEFPPSYRPSIGMGTFFTDADHKVWMANNDYGNRKPAGVFTFNFQKDRLLPVDLGDTLNKVAISFIDQHASDKHSLWLGTNEGLCLLHTENMVRRWFYPRDDLPDLINNTILSCLQTGGKIWMHLEDTFSGKLGFFDLADQRFHSIALTTSATGYPQGILVRGMAEGPGGTVWLATGIGLGRIDPNPEPRFALIRTGTPFVDDGLMGIACDRRGILWLKSMHHVCRYDPNGKKIHCFSALQDMQEFNTVGASTGADGRILFHGNNGIYAFYPEKVQLNNVTPRVVLTGIQINNQPFDDGRAPELVDGLVLNHRHRVVTFEYAGLHFINPAQNTYRYRLEGFEDSWVEAGTERRATYTNLRAGHYAFHVKAANPDGFWGHELVIPITILPPWWATWWAYGLYFSLLVAIIFTIYHFHLHRRLASAEAVRLRELDAFKSRFYTNITHEFRTPLTLIEGPVERALRRAQPLSRQELLTIRSNGHRLLWLIDQMLTLGKLDAGVLRPEYTEGDVIAFLRYVVESFHSIADNKNIELTFTSDRPEGLYRYDRQKLEMIICNLLSNALKFTPEEGKVQLAVFSWQSSTTDARRAKAGDSLPSAGGHHPGAGSDPGLHIVVQDSGPGIPEEQLDRIFDRFYQAGDGNHRKTGGSGIGLALTKELVGLLGGKIQVGSRPGEGSRFTVWLPCKPAKRGTTSSRAKGSVRLASRNDGPPQLSDPAADTRKALILIVEDHRDVARFIASCLRDRYRVQFARNGRHGIEKALERIPDLILCDIMMPEVDGYEVCKTLKSDLRTSHIPIVLLTARADQASRLRGLDCGADAYLNKPFSEEELNIRVSKLLELRRKMRAHYRALLTGPDATATEPLPPTPENAFLQKVRVAVEQHYTDSDFGVAALCRRLAMSQPQLHRKLTAVAGVSPSRFIRSLRLEHARRLLADPDLTVSEVAYDAGFSSPGYFATVFREAFGMTPTGYREENVRP